MTDHNSLKEIRKSSDTKADFVYIIEGINNASPSSRLPLYQKSCNDKGDARWVFDPSKAERFKTEETAKRRVKKIEARFRQLAFQAPASVRNIVHTAIEV